MASKTHTSDLTTFTNVARGGSGTGNWASPGNAATSNDTKTTVTVDLGGTATTPWLQGVALVTPMPAGVPTQITVVYERSKGGIGSPGSVNKDSAFHMVKAGTIETGVDKADTSTAYTSTDVQITKTFTQANLTTLGILTEANVNHAGFGFAVSVSYDDSVNESGEPPQVDYIGTVTITYTPTRRKGWIPQIMRMVLALCQSLRLQ